MRLGRASTWDTPLVVQVSRWDPLKDMVGVMHGFTKILDGGAPVDADLVLCRAEREGAWPTIPRVRRCFDARRRGLAASSRTRSATASISPRCRRTTCDENAAIVNALQRHATVVVQKSLTRASD